MKDLSKLIAKLSCLVLIASLLQGCVEAIIATGAAVGVAATSVIYDKRSVNRIYHDKKLSALIQQRINANPEFDRYCHVAATTYQGWVLLVGQAPTKALKQQIIDAVNTTPGIVRLYNEIQVAPPINQMQQSKDVWITTQAKSELLQIQGLKSAQIKITTENDVVYLLGIVTKKQAEAAVNIISRIKGVKKVVKIFDINNN